ncbi:testis-specific serine/threonine-protein kinase 4 isoform X2 [Halyomorpha halys]|uniref:testis-specific serine/threonine-protein kinase 4 isoform X2 n=1 Tax=Halyomorpha halys TaxID=286706 RepID=UPI0006D4CE30
MESSQNLVSNTQVVGTAKTKSKSRVTTPQWTIHDDDSVLKETGYEMMKKIGHGSFAKVWKAKSFRLKKDVAVKIIAKPLASTEYVERFLPRELAIIQKLKHKNLIRFFEVIETWHSVYIVMDLAEKGTIADLIERKKFIPENQSRRFYTQLLDVVEYCHLNGIVHRDIKCENLLLDREGTLLLTDFGFAKQDVYPLASGRFKPSKTYCGSYAYAPPEVLANKPYNPCLADVWCMGMVLYTMLYGILPYKHQNMKALIAAKKKPPHFPDSPFVTQRARRFLLLMLATEAERAEITTLRKNQWLHVPKPATMKRFTWLPGVKPTTVNEATTTVLNHCIPETSAVMIVGHQIEDKSVSANLSGMMENRISIEQSSQCGSSISEQIEEMSESANLYGMIKNRISMEQSCQCGSSIPEATTILTSSIPLWKSRSDHR